MWFLWVRSNSFKELKVDDNMSLDEKTSRYREDVSLGEGTLITKEWQGDLICAAKIKKQLLTSPFTFIYIYIYIYIYIFIS